MGNLHHMYYIYLKILKQKQLSELRVTLFPTCIPSDSVTFLISGFNSYESPHMKF